MTAETAGERIAEPATSAGSASLNGLRRSKTQRVLAGVCGGIAEAYGSDPVAVRLLTVIIGIVTGIVPMLVLYLVAAVIIPEAADGERSGGTIARQRVTPGQGALAVGLVLIVGGLAALANELLNVDWDVLWPLALIGVGAAVVVMAARR